MEQALDIRIRMAEMQLSALQNKFRQDSVSYQRQIRKLNKQLKEKSAVSYQLRQQMLEIAQEQKKFSQQVEKLRNEMGEDVQQDQLRATIQKHSKATKIVISELNTTGSTLPQSKPSTILSRSGNWRPKLKIQLFRGAKSVNSCQFSPTLFQSTSLTSPQKIRKNASKESISYRRAFK